LRQNRSSRAARKFGGSRSILDASDQPVARCKTLASSLAVFGVGYMLRRCRVVGNCLEFGVS
jgi:hypothetical protein